MWKWYQPQPFDAHVVFIDTDVPILLGRDAFFDAYRIKDTPNNKRIAVRRGASE
jgi:hypothetical protein